MVAERQHGRVAHWQLREIGLSASAIQRWVRAGRLHPVHKGVYAVGYTAAGYRARWMGGVLALGPDAILSHQNAAALHDLRRMSSAAIHVTVHGGTRRGPRGVTVHRARRLDPEDRTVVEGIPVTSVARTLLDLAEVLPLRQLIRAIEQAERLRLFNLSAIETLLARSHGRRGVKSLRRAIEAVNGEAPHVNSDWERDFLDFCADHGLPKPELNVIVEGYEVDALWRDRDLIVELDSYAFHRSWRAFEEDRRRYPTLQLAGYLVLPLTRLDDETAQLLSAAIAAR
jgi:hypothetical protein